MSASLLVVFAVFADATTGYTSGVLPIQFYRELEGDRLEDYTGLFSVAHNSGDRVQSANQALAYGADIIEIDVVALDDRLYAAHQAPLPFLGPHVFRGPKLEEIWTVASLAEVVKLDLKQSSSSFLDLLVSFLGKYGEDQQVIVASGDVEVLRSLGERWPDAFRLLSVPNREVMDALQADPDLVALIDGVTIQEQLLDRETATWLEAQELYALAWTVNSLGRVNALIGLGVDGITTDNLALMRLLGGGRRGELPLARRQPGQPGLGPAQESSNNQTNDEPDEPRASERPPQSDLHPPDQEPHLHQFEVIHDDADEPGKDDGDED